MAEDNNKLPKLDFTKLRLPPAEVNGHSAVGEDMTQASDETEDNTIPAGDEDPYAWKNGKTCGDCYNLRMLTRAAQVQLSGGNLAAPQMGDCFGTPPVPVMMGAQRGPNGAQQPIMSMQQPRIPVNYPACQFFVQHPGRQS